MLTPSFHFQILKRFLDVFNKNGNILVQRLSSHVDGQGFDISEYIVTCSLDVICGELSRYTHKSELRIHYVMRNELFRYTHVSEMCAHHDTPSIIPLHSISEL
jgi:hypothetical protein